MTVSRRILTYEEVHENYFKIFATIDVQDIIFGCYASGYNFETAMLDLDFRTRELMDYIMKDKLQVCQLTN